MKLPRDRAPTSQDCKELILAIKDDEVDENELRSQINAQFQRGFEAYANSQEGSDGRFKEAAHLVDQAAQQLVGGFYWVIFNNDSPEGLCFSEEEAGRIVAKKRVDSTVESHYWHYHTVRFMRDEPDEVEGG